MQTVIDSILLNYDILGKGNKKTILILHGWKNSIKNWEKIAQNLSKQNRVVLVDLPGMGNSSLPQKQPFDTFDYANITIKFIEKLNLKNIVVIGHSFGGKIAIAMASKSNLFKKIILVDPSGINNKNFNIKFKIYLSKTIKFLLPNIISKKIYKLTTSDDYKNAGNLLPSFKTIVKQDISEYAKKIIIPTLIIWGENDKEVELSTAKILKGLIKNSHIRIVWRAGHHPHLDKPDKFLETVQEFI